MFLKKTIVSTH